MQIKKKHFSILTLIIVLTLLVAAYKYFLAPTKIAFVNYQITTLGRIGKANDNKYIKISELSVDELDKLTNYDMIFINGMGLKIVEEQRAILQKAMDKKIPILTSSATNPANNLSSLDSIHIKIMYEYIGFGGMRNYRSLLNYVRKEIHKKSTHIDSIMPPERRAYDVLYHKDPKNKRNELEFTTVREYEAFLSKHGLYQTSGKKIVVTGEMADPTGLIDKLEQAGHNVYPVRTFRKLIPFLQMINPDALVNMAHGRLGDQLVHFLEYKNILLFSPLTINRLVIDWEDDPKGMFGGFLSQSVVTPEIDGALRTSTVFALRKNEEGLHESFAVPERADAYVQTLNNYLSLKDKANAEKRIAIVYFKGPGQNALTAGGMEVVPSIFNFLSDLKSKGYYVAGLPSTSKELESIIMRQGAVFGAYAEGTIDTFLSKPPLSISKEEYESWAKNRFRAEEYAEIEKHYGPFPGKYMNIDENNLALAAIRFGNIVLMPQPAAGMGSNEFQVVHGAKMPPPYPYTATYLWIREGFGADALIHFGTHGSLEFTPKKQVALSSKDWPDRLVYDLPHFYIYTISNVGEGIIAKRRSYAGLQTYLTPPFMESNLRKTYKELDDLIHQYFHAIKEVHEAKEGKVSDNSLNRIQNEVKNASLNVKQLTVKLGIHRELALDSIVTVPYSEEEIIKIENFAEELMNEKITGQLYTMGIPYEKDRILSSVFAMCTDPIAYSMFNIDKMKGITDNELLKQMALFNRRYTVSAKSIVAEVLKKSTVSDEYIASVTGLKIQDIALAHEVIKTVSESSSMRMPPMMGPRKKIVKAFSKDTLEFAKAVIELERTIKNINRYRELLKQSPKIELISLENALNGGYTKPSPGGDPIVNSNTLPTGRNMYSINAEATPSEAAWEKGKQLAENTIEAYQKRHNGEFPRKVSYTLWSGEFIETEGATIAQVLYMLGVEPIRDSFGRVNDIKLIPLKELGRPRIDVIVQTSGQLRDLAASRLFLINRAVEMAAQDNSELYENNVREGLVETERFLVEKGVSPKKARSMAAYRVFGGVNGNYGTSIQGMVEAGDRWENEVEIAKVYLNNMGAFYGNEKEWESFQQDLFAAALTRTDVVIQPRQSNTWGALSLDHVYEFMGGLNLAVRNVTGKDPDAYLSDYRNRHRVRIQEVKEAIGVESRTTILNPTYIAEKMKGEASSAGVFAETIRNTYGWNVMKPSVIDDELWNDIFDVYVKDKFNLNLKEYFASQNPAALEEISAVMLETIRKGMWEASEEQIKRLSELHAELVEKYGASCSGFVCNNLKLQEFIKNKLDVSKQAEYTQGIKTVREKTVQKDSKDKDIVMKKEQYNAQRDIRENKININWIIVLSVVTLLLLLFVVVIRKKNN